MVFLRISTDSLNRKLAALAGFVPKRPIDLQPSDFTSPDLVLGLQSLVDSFVRQLANERARISPIALREQEQAIVIQFLLACRHNFSAVLETDESPFIPAAVRLAAEYIDANCGGAITIEALAEASGVSARTLFKSFSRAYGVSPKIFVKKRRLERARKLLAAGGPDASVTAIAFVCGFTNIGHFACDYRTAFGELPSETLSRRGCRIIGSG
jgi:transcriptional regulator GlxA family with amidase domain